MLTYSQLKERISLVREHAFKKRWENCASVASHTILLGCGPNASLTLYRYWIESLQGMSDFGGLVNLSRHVLSQRRSNFECVPLALLASCYSGRKIYASRIFEQIEKAEKQYPQKFSFLTKESQAVYLATFGNNIERKKGLNGLKHLAHLDKGWFCTSLNFGRLSLENGDFENAATAFSLLKKQFPRADDCERQLAYSALAEENYTAAAGFLSEILAGNSADTEVILNLAASLICTGELLAARDLLLAKQPLFDKCDFGFNLLFASVQERLFEKFGFSEKKISAVSGYALALRAALKVGIPEGSIHLALHRLGAGVGEQSFDRLFEPEFNKKRNPLKSATAEKAHTFWLLSCEDKLLKGIISKEKTLLRVPGEFKKNDYVFVSRRFHDADEFVVGVLKVNSLSVPDLEFGRAAELSAFKAFDVPIEIKRPQETESAKDLWGCTNFSMLSRAQFYELEQDVVQWILMKAEDSDLISQEDEFLSAV